MLQKMKELKEDGYVIKIICTQNNAVPQRYSKVAIFIEEKEINACIKIVEQYIPRCNETRIFICTKAEFTSLFL